MPIPKPKKNEKQGEFISRCISAQSEENIPNKQKVAICFTTWKESKKKGKKNGK